jgi:hypothetical protein
MRDAKAEFPAISGNRADCCEDPRIWSECSAEWRNFCIPRSRHA